MTDWKATAQNAVAALQQWHAPSSDQYASMTGLYHWDDPNIVGELGGDDLAAVESLLMSLYGYTDAFQDTERWWNSANAITSSKNRPAARSRRGTHMPVVTIRSLCRQNRVDAEQALQHVAIDRCPAPYLATSQPDDRRQGLAP